MCCERHRIKYIILSIIATWTPVFQIKLSNTKVKLSSWFIARVQLVSLSLFLLHLCLFSSKQPSPPPSTTTNQQVPAAAANYPDPDISLTIDIMNYESVRPSLTSLLRTQTHMHVHTFPAPPDKPICSGPACPIH